MSTQTGTGFRRLSYWLRPKRRCLLCGARTGNALCTACFDDMPSAGAACLRCARRLATSALRCGECLQLPPPFVSANAPFDYRFPLDVLIQRFKYAPDPTLLPALMQLIEPHWFVLCSAPCELIPIPLHRDRERQRGFNQAALLAAALADITGLALRTGWLTKPRPTLPQAQLSRARRLANLHGVFHASPAVAGRRIFLVDDIITTGATVACAAQALLQAGAASVRVMALARALG